MCLTYLHAGSREARYDRILQFLAPCLLTRHSSSMYTYFITEIPQNLERGRVLLSWKVALTLCFAIYCYGLSFYLTLLSIVSEFHVEKGWTRTTVKRCRRLQSLTLSRLGFDVYIGTRVQTDLLASRRVPHLASRLGVTSSCYSDLPLFPSLRCTLLIKLSQLL